MSAGNGHPDFFCLVLSTTSSSLFFLTSWVRQSMSRGHRVWLWVWLWVDKMGCLPAKRVHTTQVLLIIISTRQFVPLSLHCLALADWGYCGRLTLRIAAPSDDGIGAGLSFLDTSVSHETRH